MEVEVVIIIINHNSCDDTNSCLESLLLNNTTGVKIYVVDNSTNSTSSIKIQYWLNNYKGSSSILNYNIYSEADFLKLTGKDNSLLSLIIAENKGFGAANNIVFKNYIRLAEGNTWFWLLNNDTRIPSNFIEKTRKIISDKQLFFKKVGMIGHRLVDYNNPSSVQVDYGLFNRKTFRTSNHIENPASNNNFLIPDNAYIIGASMFISIEFIKDVGMLCEGNFLYFEEIDITLRGKRKGWSFLYTPTLTIEHKGFNDRNRIINNDLLRDVCLTINRFRTSFRYLPENHLIAYFIYVLAITARILQGRFTNAKILMIFIIFCKKASEGSIIKFLKNTNLIKETDKQ